MSASAVVAALGSAPGPVEVTGNGALAEQVCRLLGSRVFSSTGDARPGAVIETTGERQALEAALARVDHLGTVVLAGPEPTEPWPLDLYAELHVRGLVVVGVPHPQA
jgi:threonine dehydrogenase-like Zn-dependent dehydrogenase